MLWTMAGVASQGKVVGYECSGVTAALWELQCRKGSPLLRPARRVMLIARNIPTELMHGQGGRLSVVGVYVATINHFMFGPLFEKGMSLKAGQTPCQAYWPDLLEMVTSGEHPALSLQIWMPNLLMWEAIFGTDGLQSGSAKFLSETALPT